MFKKRWMLPAQTAQWDALREELINLHKEDNASLADVVSYLVAAEEIFVNIAQYAYRANVAQKDAVVQVELIIEHLNQQKMRSMIRFSDYGVPFNPCAYKGRTITEKTTSLGGWGIVIAKSKVDGLQYKRENGQNQIILIKVLDIDNGG